MTKKCKLTCSLIIIQFLFPIFYPAALSSQGKTIEDLDPEYCISDVQAQFLPWWEDIWEKTITGFRIRGASFDLHTLHTLQHWKGRFPFNDYFLFTFDYFTDAYADSQFYKREMELKWKVKKNHFLSLFGYPYYDKKQSDIGIRYSFEETPFDFIRFSILFENTVNNYTFKDRDMDSMRIYRKIPILYSLNISVIKKERNRLIISYNIEQPYRADYENKKSDILYKTEGEHSNLAIKHRYYFADSTELGWDISFQYYKKDYLSTKGEIDSSQQHIRLRKGIYLNKNITSIYNLIFVYNSDLEEKANYFGVNRNATMIGIFRDFPSHSMVGLSYCNGFTHYISKDKKRKDNRLILSAEHSFRNNAMVGLNLGIELDNRDTTHGWLGRYDKLFLFLQYPLK